MKSSASVRPDVLQTVASIAVLLLMLVVIGGLLWVIMFVLISLPATVAAAIVAGSATILVSVFSLIFSKRMDRTREIEQEHRKQKAPIYEEFLSFLFKLFNSNRGGESTMSLDDMKEYFGSFFQQLIVWGSDDVLKQFEAFRQAATSVAEHSKMPTEDIDQGQKQQLLQAQIKSMQEFEKLLYAIRADLGHKNQNMRVGNLLSVFVTDARTYLRRD